jgi:hypothetical protein
MAIVRTVLPRKGFVQPQHGLTQYEGDMDGNMSLLDANVAFIGDLPSAGIAGDLGMNGVVSGLALSTSTTLYPGIAIGVLYANGVRTAWSIAPSLPAAPASATSYLFYNTTTGFYYQTGAVGATAGDALIGIVVASSSAITGVTQATKLFGQVSVAPSGSGNFTVAHLLGRKPNLAIIRPTSSASIWFQTPTDTDGTNLYLDASGSGTAEVVVW